MPITFNYADLVKELDTLITGRLNSETICLFTGDHTPSLSDSTFNYLGVEANFQGYARYPLVFNAAVQSADSIAYTTSQIQVWRVAGLVNTPQTVTGVFALDADGECAWAERLPLGPVLLTSVGQVAVYQAVVTMPP